MKRISTRVLVDNPYHRYRRDRVRRRDGSEGDYYYIDHPLSVAVVAAFTDGTVLVQRCYRYLFGEFMHQLVLGHVEPGRAPREQAARELGEETGWHPGRVTPLGRFTPCSGLANETCHAFLGRDLERVRPELEPTEELEVLRLSRREARAFLLDAPRPCGQSLSAWLLYERLQGD